MQGLRRCLGLVAAALAALLPVTAVHAAEPASVMIVLDGSGSMAGLLEPKGKQAKVALVRDALRAALSTTDQQARIGLAAFGHRRGTCTDTEIMRAPQPVDVGAMIAPLSQMKPKFKGPIAYALREAAKQLPNDGSPRSLVLIHDGADNCQQDVCAAAAELAAAGIATHVVSLAVPADELAKTACIWQATGGRNFKVETAEQLDAGIAEALRVATGGDPGATAAVGMAPAVGSWAASVAPPPPVPATGPAALHLRALWAPNAEPAGVSLQWSVARKDAPEAVLAEASTANPVIPVPPGDYVVTVRSDLVSASRVVTIRDNRPVAVPVMLGAGPLRVRAVAQRSSTPLTDAVITVASMDGTPLAVFKTAEATTLLPPGRYRIGAEIGLVRTEQTITVTEGRPVQVDLLVNIGRLQLTAPPRDGTGPAETPLFIVMEDDPPRGRREVAQSAASQAEFVLPPGTYYVVVRQGGAETRERLEIASGDIVRRTLGAAVGRLALSTSGPTALAGNLSYTVKRLDDPDQDTVWTSQPSPLLSLPAGRYRVEGRYGLTNVATTRDVEIKAGQTLQLPIEHQAATLRVRLAGIGAGLADVTWEMRDEYGRVVWSSSQTEDAAVVQAGRYVVRADTGARKEERTVDLRAGDTKAMEIRAE